LCSVAQHIDCYTFSHWVLMRGQSKLKVRPSGLGFHPPSDLSQLQVKLGAFSPWLRRLIMTYGGGSCTSSEETPVLYSIYRDPNLQ
jgi:hypothetical protein